MISRWAILELVRIRALIALREGDSETFRRASDIMARNGRKRMDSYVPKRAEVAHA